MGENENGEGNGTVYADAWVVVVAYVAVAVAGGLAIWLAHRHDVTIAIGDGFEPFAVIYIVAQAIERFIQPFAGVSPSAKKKDDKKAELADTKVEQRAALATNEVEKAKEAAKEVAVKGKELAKIEADRVTAFWALATFLALIACGFLSLGLIQSVATVTDSGGEIPNWFKNADVIITGLAIGAGTKPLHDLIEVIQSKKQKAAGDTPSAA